MIETLKKIFGIGPRVDYAELVKAGALIVDVRTREEFKGGHIKGSINIALNNMNGHLHQLRDKNHPVILCCASGMRSGAAKNLLKGKGYTQVYNAGSWYSLQNKLR